MLDRLAALAGAPQLPDPKYIYHGSVAEGGDDLFLFAEAGAVDIGPDGTPCPDCERLFTTDQMHAYADLAAREQRERDAELCRGMDCAHLCRVGAEFAAAILAQPEPGP